MFSRAAYLGLSSFVLLAAAAAAEAPPLSLGLYANSRAWPWMSESMFDGQRDLGALDSRVEVQWSKLHTQADEPVDWSTIDNRFANIEGDAGERSMRPVPVITIGRGWMTCPVNCADLINSGACPAEQLGSCVVQPGCDCCTRTSCDASQSKLPEDLGTAWSQQTGYSPSFYDFMHEFTERYHDRIDYVVIENESDNTIFWDVEADPDGMAYVRLLNTAHKAIKDVDPSLKVVDSGFVSGFLAGCYIQDFLEENPGEEEWAFENLYQVFYGPDRLRPCEYRPWTHKCDADCWDDRCIDSAADMANLMATNPPECWRLENLAAEGNFDVFNYHFYADYRSADWLPALLADVEEEAGNTPRPVLTNEIGYYRQEEDDDLDTSGHQARELFTKLIATLATGIEMATWYGVDKDDGSGAVSLWDSSGNRLPAAETYEFLAETLGEDYRPVIPAERGPEVFHARFADAATGAAKAEALWSFDGASHAVELIAPPSYSQLSVYDDRGSLTRVLTAVDGLIPWTATSDPILGLWRQTAGPCVADAVTLCLNDGRFKVQVGWRDYQSNIGSGQAMPLTTDSGLFWFFNPNNIEFLVKVLNGCGVNGHYWVYAAATTDVEYTLTVTDTQNGGEVSSYTNPLGSASPAITDSGAFATCP